MRKTWQNLFFTIKTLKVCWKDPDITDFPNCVVRMTTNTHSRRNLNKVSQENERNEEKIAFRIVKSLKFKAKKF